jgi:hypothetical protein
MIYKTIIVENTFKAGVAVGSLRSHFASQGCGEVNIVNSNENHVEVEISAYNPLIMSYAEDRLADFV